MTNQADTGLLTSLQGRYAKALFDLAYEQKSLDLCLESLDKLNATITSNPMLANSIKNPAVHKEQGAAVITAIAKKMGFPKVIQSFLKYVALGGRLQNLQAITDAYRTFLAVSRGEQDLEIVSAYPLTGAQEQKLIQYFKSSHKRTIKFSFNQDPSLYGGILFRIGGHVIDTTVTNRLNQFVTTMKERTT